MLPKGRDDGRPVTTLRKTQRFQLSFEDMFRQKTLSS